MATHANTIWALAVIKAFLGIDVAETGKDVQVEQLADGVSAWMERYTGYQFVTRAVTEAIDGDGASPILTLRYRPVVAVSSLTIGRAEGEAAETIDAADYAVALSSGRLRLLAGDVFTEGFSNIAVTYTAGYGAQGAATLPRDIYAVGLEILKLEFTLQDTGFAGAQSLQVPSVGSFTPRATWPPFVWAVLDSWRRVA